MTLFLLLSAEVRVDRRKVDVLSLYRNYTQDG